MLRAITLGDSVTTEEQHRTYRLRRRYFRIGIISTSVFTVMWGSTIAFLLNAPEAELKARAAAFVLPTAIFGFLISVGLSLCVTSIRYRLQVSEKSIRHVGVFRTMTIHLDDVREVRWRLFPQFGSCVITSHDHRVVVEFANFLADERTELVNYFRENVGVEYQTDWDLFRDRFFEVSLKRKQQQEVVNRLVELAFGASAIGFAVVWYSGLGIQYLVISAVNLGAAIYLNRKRATSAAMSALQPIRSEPVGDRNA